MPETIIIKARWWEFWKPLEKVVVICSHRWEEEANWKHTYRDSTVGSTILYKCLECGKFKIIEI